MAITQIIAPLPAILNDSETFYEDIAVRNNSLVTVSFPSINTWASQANALAVEVNDKAAQVAAQAVDGGYSQNYINSNFFSQNYINSNFFSQTYINTNFVGVNNAQNITAIKTFTVSPIVPTPTTGTQVANKAYVDSKTLNINTLTDKPTPINTDNFVLQEVGGLLKKLSFANLVNWIKSFSFGWGQTWQNVTSSRSAGVTYTNNTGKPIMVNPISSASASNNINIIIDGIDLGPNTFNASSGPSSNRNIVPNGSTYKVNISGATLGAWHELR